MAVPTQKGSRALPFGFSARGYTVWAVHDWPCLVEVSESLWTFLEVYGSVWKFMEVYGSFYKFLEVSGVCSLNL